MDSSTNALLIQLRHDGTTRDLFEITRLEDGAIQVKGVGAAAFLGTDLVSNVDRLDFVIEGAPGLFGSHVRAWTSSTSTGFFVLGGIFDDVIDAGTIPGISDTLTVKAIGADGNDTILGHEGRDELEGNLGNDVLKGRGGADSLKGGDGDDVLDGGSGADILAGEAGHDTYVVDSADDVIVEDAGGGTDTVLTTVSTVLSLNVEILRAADLLSTAALALTGNVLGNTITGNAGNNVLSGIGGNDTLSGGAGNDKLQGGLGKDTLYGGAGKDVFVFDTKPALSNMDTIKDFSVPDDTIYLENSIFTKVGSGTPQSPRKLSAAAFWIGTKAHDTSDRIVYDKASGSLYYDPDGTGAAAQVRFAILPKNLKLTYADFFVI